MRPEFCNQIKRERLSWLLAVLLPVLLYAGCGDDGGSPTTPPTSPPPPTPVATSVSLSLSSITFESLGATQQISATVRDQNGSAMSGAGVSWATSTPAVATVSSSGMVTSVGNGTATITASYAALSATAAVTVDAPPQCDNYSIKVGTTGSAALATDDCALTSGQYMDWWIIELEEGHDVQIDMTSTAFDTYMFLMDTAGTVLIENDDVVSGNSNSQIVTTLDPGVYFILATSFTAAATGSYTLALSGTPVISCDLYEIAVGQSGNAALATDDCVLDSGRHVDLWGFVLDEDYDVQIDMTSSAFDTYLFLTDTAGNVLIENDDAPGSSNSQIVTTLDAGTYFIMATSYLANERGSYTLALSGTPAVSCDLYEIAVGETGNAALATDDCALDAGQYVDLWGFELDEEHTVQIDMTSSAFDTYLFLVDTAGNTVAYDDDGGTGYNSQIVTTLDAGTYVILASSAYANKTGSYTLALAGEPKSSCDLYEIAVGQSGSAALATDDCTLDTGEYVDLWGFVLTEDHEVQIDMTSSAFDTYLALTDADGNVLAENDDVVSGNSNSQIADTLAAGTYFILATSFEAAETGSYTLALSGAPAVSCDLYEIAVGQAGSAALETNDCTLSGGQYVDAWGFVLDEGHDVQIDMKSSAFDTYLILVDTAGNTVASDDDGGTGYNSLIVGSLDPGIYFILATSASANATGNYQLTLAGEPSVSCDLYEIEVGQTGSGALATDDCTLDSGEYVDLWGFELDEDQEVQIDMTSSAFDTYLILLDTDGNTVTYDDQSGTGNNAQIVDTLAAGTYVVLATSYSANATGSYELQLTGTPTASCDLYEIALGQTGNATLDTKDCEMTGGYYVDAWAFSLSTAHDVQIDMTSSAFDTYLLLVDTAGTVLVEDNNGGTGTNSQIVGSLDPGIYIILASTNYQATTGNYQVKLAGEPTGDCDILPIGIGKTENGTLDTGDCALTSSNAEYADAWTFELDGDHNIQIDMTSSAFDAYLLLVDSAGNVLAENDDGGTGTNAQIAGLLGAGSYAIFTTSNAVGETGNYQVSLAATPVSAGSWESVSGGDDHTCAVTPAGAGYCWGSNYRGELGNGTTTGIIEANPVPILVSGGHTWAFIDAGHSRTCGVTTAGAGYCWGQNGSNGVLGNGTTEDSTTPVLVSGGHTWTMIDIGYEYACGVTTAGAAYCWGRNGFYGPLGNGTTTDSTTPVPVIGGHTFASVETGYAFSCGVTTAGPAYCWGRNVGGELGNGRPLPHYSRTPVLVSGGHTWASISPGWDTACGVTRAGAAYCWGDNEYAEVGDGTLTRRNVPVLVSGGKTWVQAATYFRHSCGVTTAGAGYCWGSGQYGQLGSGTTEDSTTPVLVSGGHLWASLSPGNTSASHTCGVTNLGTLNCWGHNGNGRLGDGSGTSSNIPVRVITGSGEAVGFDAPEIYTENYRAMLELQRYEIEQKIQEDELKRRRLEGGPPGLLRRE